jgi:hypothetical protein
MSLDDLNRRLYEKNPDMTDRKHEASQYDPNQNPAGNAQEFQQEKKWEQPSGEEDSFRKKATKIGALIVVALIIITGSIIGIVKYKQSAFTESKVAVAVKGADSVDSTDLISYKITYSNDNRVDLNNAEMLLGYAENFQPEKNPNLISENQTNSKIKIGTIKAHSKGEVEIQGKFYGPKDYVVYLNATLNYTPSNFNSLFQSTNKLGVNVRTSPITLEVAAPLEAANGNSVEYTIDYKNISNRNFDNISLQVEYPGKFNFVSANPKPTDGNKDWYVGMIGPNQSGKIKILGSINGLSEEGKTFKVSLGLPGGDGQFIAYSQKEAVTKIISSPLFISQTVNGGNNVNANAGQTLDYNIVYANNGDVGLRDAIITMEINSPVLDFSKLKLKNGAYDASRKIITWRASDIPGLAILSPGQKGQIDFNIPVYNIIPVSNENEKNFVIVSIAKIDSPDVPTPMGSNKIISSNKMEMKLNSKVVLENEAFYKDADIANIGPIPPRIGKETTYAIRWKITNVSNDVSDVAVVSSMPSGVRWTGKFYPQQEQLAFDERTNQIVWNIGKIKNAIGVVSPKKEVVFQVSVIPQVNQLDSSIFLLNPATLTGKDLFTGQDIKVETKELENRTAEGSGYKVTN